VFFTEIGYPSGNGLRWQHPSAADYQLQADQYEGLFLATQGEEDWFLGANWWNWETE
jgi:hypothetical protein